MKIRNSILRDIVHAFLIGTLIYLVVLLILFFLGRFDNGFSFQFAWREYYYNLILSFILYYANVGVWRYFDKYFDCDSRTIKQHIISLSSNFIVSVLGIFISKVIIKVGIENQGFLDFIENQSFNQYYFSLIIVAVVLAVYHFIDYYKRRQESKVKEQKIIAGTASAKFDALKNQLDPHFLFNSLNVLTSLIEEDPYHAQKFTTSLSKVYRYVLEQKNKDLVTVDEELQFARTYVRLLKMRFEDSIVFEIPEKSTNPEAKIIPLSLQLLLENAVKHNVVTAEKPLYIKVLEDEESDMLIVSNNLQEKKVVKKSSGVGLTNIQQRYGILTDRVVQIHKTSLEFRVELPMLTKKISTMETQEIYLEDKRYEKAKERVEAIKGFYGNLTAYCIVIPVLIYINYTTTSFPWAIFPALGWGFGVLTHGLEAFGFNPLFGKDWEERKMKEFMNDDNF